MENQQGKQDAEHVNVFNVYEYNVCKAMAKVTPKQYWLDDFNPAFFGKKRLDKFEVSLSADEAVQRAVKEAEDRLASAEKELESARFNLQEMKKLSEQVSEQALLEGI